MSPDASRFVRSMPLALIAILIWLPRAAGEDPASRPATTQKSTSAAASTSQPSDLEIELREGRRIIEETAAVYKRVCEKPVFCR